jgi:hypothetical protein
MDCSECVADVEVWRAIKLELPPATVTVRRGFVQRKTLDFVDWRMAASLVGVGVISAAGGWIGKATVSTEIDSTQTVVFSLPSVSRGADECAELRLAPDTHVALLRVAGLPLNRHVVALDAEGRELPAGQYTAWTQPDRSRVVRINAALLEGRAIHLEGKTADGTIEPLGCVTGETSAARK